MGVSFSPAPLISAFPRITAKRLNIWDKQAVLSDVVRVIREFRPDVVITRFSTVPGGTHGHHTASAVLALEAFKLAGDTNAFPDQLRELPPWKPKRILWNSGGFQRGGTGTNVIRMEITGNDPVSGETFAEVAGRSRSMHKTLETTRVPEECVPAPRRQFPKLVGKSICITGQFGGLHATDAV